MSLVCVYLLHCFSIWQINTCWKKEYLFILQIFVCIFLQQQNKLKWYSNRKALLIFTLYYHPHIHIWILNIHLWMLNIHLPLYTHVSVSTSWRIFYTYNCFIPNFLHLFLKNAIKPSSSHQNGINEGLKHSIQWYLSPGDILVFPCTWIELIKLNNKKWLHTTMFEPRFLKGI